MRIELHSESSGTGGERGKERGDIMEKQSQWLRGKGKRGRECCAVPTAICLFINYLASKAKRTADECRTMGRGRRRGGVARARASKNIDS